jgi:hypothetical protein
MPKHSPERRHHRRYRVVPVQVVLVHHHCARHEDQLLRDHEGDQHQDEQDPFGRELKLGEGIRGQHRCRYRRGNDDAGDQQCVQNVAKEHRQSCIAVNADQTNGLGEVVEAGRGVAEWRPGPEAQRHHVAVVFYAGEQHPDKRNDRCHADDDQHQVNDRIGLVQPAARRRLPAGLGQGNGCHCSHVLVVHAVSSDSVLHNRDQQGSPARATGPARWRSRRAGTRKTVGRSEYWQSTCRCRLASSPRCG